jgi:hypothetical protein
MAYEDLLKDNSVAIENGNYFNLTLTDLNPNTSYPIQLRWKYKDGTFSDWSAVKRLDSVTVVAAPSEIPSTPTVKPVVGAIELSWNGKTSTGADQPYGFNSAKVYVGTTSNFTPVDSGSTKNLVDILDFANGQNTLNIGVGTVVNSSLTLTYGTDYYVRIKTTNGNVLEDSAVVSATGNPVRIGQISNDGLVEVKADKITTGTLQSGSTITVGSTSGKSVIIRGTGNPLSIYGSGGTAGGAILDFDGSGNLSIKGTINATAGSFTGAISIGDNGSMKIGVGVNSGYNGIYIGTNNYWYNDGLFEVGNGTNFLKWNGSSLSMSGSITASSFSSTNAAAGNGINILSTTIGDITRDEIKFYSATDLKLNLYASPSGAQIAGPLSDIKFLNSGALVLGNLNNIITIASNSEGGAYLDYGYSPNASRLRNISSSTFPPTLSNLGATEDGANNGDIYLVREA